MAGSVGYWSSGIKFNTAGATGQVLTSNGASAPTFQNSSLTVAFSAYKSASSTNQTGDGTAYFLIANTELRDIGSNYNNATGIFTAPQTGLYFFSFSFGFSNIQSNHNVTNMYLSSNATIQASGRFLLNIFSVATGGQYFISSSCVQYMTSGQTAQPLVGIEGGSKVITIQGEASYVSSFSGFLIG